LDVLASQDSSQHKNDNCIKRDFSKHIKRGNWIKQGQSDIFRKDDYPSLAWSIETDPFFGYVSSSTGRIL
jgi:hypothetical protein